MNISNRICNPSPFDVEWDYDKGVQLKIPADGHLDLTVEVMDDFREGKPGSPEVQGMMNHYGIFLRDPSQPFELQAIKALEASIKDKQGQYNDAHGNLRRNAAAQGTFDEGAFAETLHQMGYTALKAEIERLKGRLTQYTSRVNTERIIHEQFDLERTLIFLDPPKEFDSKVQMEIFLSENPELKERHEKWLAAQGE